MSVAVENEIKAGVESFDKIKDALLVMGAKRLSAVDEKNVLYDNGAGDLKAEDVGLRLRCEGACDGSSRVILTLKGPRMGGETKKRQEFEVNVTDFGRAQEMIFALGFVKALAYEKIRERWAVFGVEVCLDTLPFGKYVEVEGREKDILYVAKKLGFSKDDFITSNYFDLARQKGVLGDVVFKS